MNSIFTDRVTPVSAQTFAQLVAGDGLANAGDLALGGSTGLYWEDDTKRLGLGTQTPQTALDVDAGASACAATWATDAEADVIHWLIGDRDDDDSGALHAFVGLDYSADVLKIGRGDDFDAATAYLAMDASGSIGIGTAPAGYPLDVLSGNNAQTIRAMSATDNAALTIENTGTGGHRWNLYSTGGTSGYGQGAWVLEDNTAGQPRLAIDSTGKVGLGTGSPGSALELNLATADLEIVDAGTAGATEAGWVTVKIGASTMYLRAYSAI